MQASAFLQDVDCCARRGAKAPRVVTPRSLPFAPIPARLQLQHGAATRHTVMETCFLALVQPPQPMPCTCCEQSEPVKLTSFGDPFLAGSELLPLRAVRQEGE